MEDWIIFCLSLLFWIIVFWLPIYIRKICNKLNTNNIIYNNENNESYDSDNEYNYITNNDVIIENVPIKKNKKNIIQEIKTFSNINKQYQFCSICQTKCQDTIFTNCNHSFCEECISIHIEHNYNCPNCKAHISSLYKIIALKINFQNI